MTIPLVQNEVETSAVKTTTPKTENTLKYAQAAAVTSPSNKSVERGTHKEYRKKKGGENNVFLTHYLSENAVQSAWNERPKIVDQPKSEGKKTLLSSQYSAAAASPATPKNETNTNTTVAALPTADRLPDSLADLAPAFESIKKNAARKDTNLQYTNQMLDASLQHVPDLIDSERPKIYQPRNPFNTPNYYPQQPLAIFDNPVLFDKFDMDTLFYIFYYQQGTYQQ